eukprot:7056925-Alexandrium_andersonii.AAC.1
METRARPQAHVCMPRTLRCGAGGTQNAKLRLGSLNSPKPALRSIKSGQAAAASTQLEKESTCARVRVCACARVRVCACA